MLIVRSSCFDIIRFEPRVARTRFSNSPFRLQDDVMRQLLIVAACVSLAACGRTDDDSDGGAGRAQSAPASAVASTGGSPGSMPKAVADVGTHGENLYDHARKRDWVNAVIAMDSLEQSAQALQPDESAQLRAVLDSLRPAVAGRRRDDAIRLSNAVTRIGAALTERYQPSTPADIVRLDYYGREIEIQAARKNLGGLRVTAADLVRTWDAVKPQVLARGGVVAAARTDSLVASLNEARTPADFARLATPILDVVDELEKAFAKK